MWHNDATREISRNSETTIIFERKLALVNLPLLSMHSFLNFHARSLPILFIRPNDATDAISSNSETATSFACTLVLVNLPLLPRALVFAFLRAIAANIIYLA